MNSCLLDPCICGACPSRKSKKTEAWLKATASRNIKLISTTEDVFHLSRDWLKLPAPENMLRIVVTFEVSQEPTASQMGEKDMSVSFRIQNTLGGT